MEFKLLPLCLIALFVSSCVTYQFQNPLKQDSRPETYRVAIIGGGAGGSSAAYHLRKFADSSPLDIPIEIDLFESADRIGGRTTTVNAFDDERYPVELGGSIFVEVNKILVNLTKEFGLNTKTNLHEAGPDSDYDLGVWDGSQFVFKQSSGEGRWQGYWDIAKLLWKYGLSPIRTQRLMKDAVGRFLNFYEAPTFPFATLQSAVMKNKLLEFTSQPGSETLAAAGISDAFARDIIQASTRVNYAQNLGQIHGLETMCCMATSGAMAVEGGNWQIFDAAVKHSQADVMLNTTIQGVIKDIHNQQYYLARNKQEGAHVRLPDPYDSIILAAPYQFSGIDFEPELARLPESIDYVSLYVTLFTSPHPLSPTFFDMAPEEWKAVPSTVLTTLSADMNSSSPEPHKFFSISTLRTIESSSSTSKPQYIYKIFSPAPLTGTFMSQLFDFQDSYTNTTASDPISGVSKNDITWSHEKNWHSYPYESPRTMFEQIRLDGWQGSGSGIWYTSGIEPFISTMETSALMGMNVAKLITQELEWRQHSIDENNDAV